MCQIKCSTKRNRMKIHISSKNLIWRHKWVICYKIIKHNAVSTIWALAWMRLKIGKFCIFFFGLYRWRPHLIWTIWYLHIAFKNLRNCRTNNSRMTSYLIYITFVNFHLIPFGEIPNLAHFVVWRYLNLF